MKLSKMGVLLLSILPALALSACQTTEIQNRVPTLNAADEQRKTCSEYPSFEAMLNELPEHKFLAGSSGEAIETPDGNTWVAFDVVNKREGRMLKFGGVEARGAHFECYDNLEWLSGLWTDLEE